ncbi:MAG: fructose 1,6-bisphosphatase [Dehalococcoidia bacterium]
MPLTLTLVHAPIGGAAARLPEVAHAVEGAARGALEDGLLADAHASAGAGMLSLVLLHEAGEGDPEVHRAAWNALDAGASVAKAFGVPGLGHGLPVDAIAGSLRGTGISYAELVLTERPAGPVVAVLATGAQLGTLNLPLARAFVDPFTTPRLLDRLRRGFMFEVHDLDEPRKRMFMAPAELYELLSCLALDDRFALKSIVTPEGAPAAVVSSARRADVLGPDAQDDAPVALVRTGDDAPELEELLGAFGASGTPGGGGVAIRGLAFHVGRSRLLDPVPVLDLVGSGGRGRPRRPEAPPDTGSWSER